MGVQTLGPRKHRQCEAIAGMAFVRCHTCGPGVHYLARCWIDQEFSCVVNYREKTLVCAFQSQRERAQEVPRDVAEYVALAGGRPSWLGVPAIVTSCMSDEEISSR